MTRTVGFNLIQLAFVIVFAPLYAGVLSRLKEIVQSRRGPSIFQPYRDLWKLFHKDEVISSETTWIFRFTPYLVFIIPLFVTTLIPVLTDYPLAFAFMGDMLAGGFFLALAGFFAALAAVDTGNPYGPMGASRTRMVGFLAGPVFMIVFFTVSFVAQSTIPYIAQQKWVASAAAFFSPAHILLLIAFLMLILAEGGKIPVDNPISSVAICRRGVASMCTGHHWRSPLPHLSERAFDSLGRDTGRSRWGRRHPRGSYRGCIYRDHVAGE